MKIDSQNELLFAKINDKIRFCVTKNKITHTDFFTEPEIVKINKFLNSINYKNYFWNGVRENADRKMLFFYPEKLSLEMAKSQIDKTLALIRITLPSSLQGTYEHRDYLSAIMKFGIVREKFGDIITYPEGADIIVQVENAEYFKQNLQELIRFRKASIEILNISELHEVQSNLEEISIIVNSMRIDNFVSEIAHCSRNKAEVFLLSEKVMQNYEVVTKNSKAVNINDIIIIRGFGRFQVKEISKTTKSNKLVVILLHNC
jgi:RNA-binding protein YlmH